MPIFSLQPDIDARLVTINSRGRMIKVWEINNEPQAPDSCLICTHYKFAEHNRQAKGGKWVHICMLYSPGWVDLGETLKIFGIKLATNFSCPSFQRRAIS